MSFDIIVRNIGSYCTDDTLKYLPPRIKDELIKSLTKSYAFWAQSDFKHILRLLIHPKLEMIDLTSADVDDDVLQILSTCKGLQRIYLTNDGTHHISKQELLNFLKSQNQLQRLQLRNCDIVDDSVLECISENCQKIDSLDVKGCREITDEGLNFLCSLKCLQGVTLSKTKITNDGLINFIKGPNGRRLKELVLDNCLHINIIGLREVPRYCPDLEIFVFYNCSCSEDMAMLYLEQSNLKNLKQLTWTVSW
ncbi:protein AMN1 homolog isoform X2 [Coccinella septempunctata]|uniref:protein AMN1 homolog isoform X2 n=1 Tax=Coccinella septempunctata TaxID=41139 RepID=UPI001D0747D5|nr:protein AMN1 homolog isoform X2 [Coccinella septempunctata]